MYTSLTQQEDDYISFLLFAETQSVRLSVEKSSCLQFVIALLNIFLTHDIKHLFEAIVCLFFYIKLFWLHMSLQAEFWGMCMAPMSVPCSFHQLGPTPCRCTQECSPAKHLQPKITHSTAFCIDLQKCFCASLHNPPPPDTEDQINRELSNIMKKTWSCFINGR